MPKFDFKPGDEAYIVLKDERRVEGPYRVAGIRRGGANGPQALLFFVDGSPDPNHFSHTDPETVFHDREAARHFALTLVEREIRETKNALSSLENERSLLLKEPKYLAGQSVWKCSRYDRDVRGPFTIESAKPNENSVYYRLKTDSFPYYADENENVLYPSKEEAKAVAVKMAAERVAEAQAALDKAKAEEKEIIDG